MRIRRTITLLVACGAIGLAVTGCGGTSAPSRAQMRRYAAAINLHATDLPKLEGQGREEEALPNPALHLPCVLHQPHTVLDEIRSERFDSPAPENMTAKILP